MFLSQIGSKCRSDSQKAPVAPRHGVQCREAQTGIAVALIGCMLPFLSAEIDQVRLEFTPAENGAPCQLTVHYADGSFVESFRTTEMGIKRMNELEELLAGFDGRPVLRSGTRVD
jgi:hypothetical protein